MPYPVTCTPAEYSELCRGQYVNVDHADLGGLHAGMLVLALTDTESQTCRIVALGGGGLTLRLSKTEPSR